MQKSQEQETQIDKPLQIQKQNDVKPRLTKIGKNHISKVFFLRSCLFRWDTKCECVLFLACVCLREKHMQIKTEHKNPVFPLFVCLFHCHLFLSHLFSWYCIYCFVHICIFSCYSSRWQLLQVEGLKGFSLVTTGLGDPEWFIFATVYLLIYF